MASLADFAPPSRQAGADGTGTVKRTSRLVDKRNSSGKEGPATTTPSRPASSVLLAINKQLEESNLRTSDFINSIDKHGGGSVSGAQLQKGLKDLAGYTANAAEMETLAKALDKNGDDSLDLKEFERALNRAAKEKDVMEDARPEAKPEGKLSKLKKFAKNVATSHNDEEVRYSEDGMSSGGKALLTIYQKLEERRMRTVDFFRKIDEDGGGTISAEELRLGLAREIGYTVTGKELRLMMKALDSDGGGSVDMKEFDRCLKRVAKGEDILAGVEDDGPETGMNLAAVASVAHAQHKLRIQGVHSEDAKKMSPQSQALLAVHYKLEVQKMRTADFCRKIDTSGDGEVSPAEFRKGLETVGFRPSNEQFKLLMQVLDKDGDNSLDVKEIDRALKRVAKGEDIMTEWEEAAPVFDAMLQVDTVMNIPTAQAGWSPNTVYVARAKWQGHDGKGPKTDARPSKQSGAGIEDCAIRQQLKLVGKEGAEYAIMSVTRRTEDGEEVLVGTCTMKVTDPASQEVHVLELMREEGPGTAGGKSGILVRLRVKLKEQKKVAAVRKAEKVESPRAPSPKPRVQELDENGEVVDHLAKMHKDHAVRQEKLEKKRQQEEEAYKLQMKEEASRLRNRDIRNSPMNPHEASMRLYQDSKDLQRRRWARQAAKDEEDRKRALEVAVTRKMNRSYSDVGLKTSQEASDRLWQDVERRHRDRVKREEEKNTAQAEEVERVTEPAKKRSQSAGAASSAQRMQELYEEAEHRRRRADDRCRQKVEAEMRLANDNQIGKDRPPVNLNRLEEMWKEHELRQKKHALAKADSQRREQEKVEAEMVEGRKRARMNLDKRKDGHSENNNNKKVPWHERLAAPRDPKPDQDAKPVATKIPKPGTTNVDYTLDTILTALRLRCSLCPAPDKKMLLEPLKAMMDEYKEAFTNCNKGEGFPNLAARASQRLYPDGHLLPDPIGWQQVCEPGPIRQVQEDFTALKETGARAQAQLEQMIAPSSSEWRLGEIRHKPAAAPMALFAYSSGPKGSEAAKTKANVRYGPGEGQKRNRHVLDMARITLVFASCDLLQAGLDIILGHFEVVDVRNYFRTPARSGNRWVEVSVILEVESEDGDPPIPHVCEIRLEENNYWKARQRVEPHKQELFGRICAHYSALGRCPTSMEYVSRWVLESPYEGHSLRVFKKHMARHYGSLIGAWRKNFGMVRAMAFSKFRDVCKELHCRDHSTEYWQDLDVGKSGRISLFELDPVSVALLAKFRLRLFALADVHLTEETSGEDLWSRFTAMLKPARGGRLEINEFRAAAKPLGFGLEEATAIFNVLDPHGGHTHAPPAYISISDFGWLRKLPNLVDLDCIALSSGDSRNEFKALATKSWRPSPGSPPYSPASPKSPTSPASPPYSPTRYAAGHPLVRNDPDGDDLDNFDEAQSGTENDSADAHDETETKDQTESYLQESGVHEEAYAPAPQEAYLRPRPSALDTPSPSPATTKFGQSNYSAASSQVSSQQLNRSKSQDVSSKEASRESPRARAATENITSGTSNRRRQQDRQVSPSAQRGRTASNGTTRTPQDQRSSSRTASQATTLPPQEAPTGQRSRSASRIATMTQQEVPAESAIVATAQAEEELPTVTSQRPSQATSEVMARGQQDSIEPDDMDDFPIGNSDPLQDGEDTDRLPAELDEETF